MATSSSSAPVVKNMKTKMQKILVYEQIKSDIALCRQNMPSKRFPVLPASKCLRLCDSQQMKRSCFPKLCDCEMRQRQLCGMERQIKYACIAIKTVALIMVLKMTYDSGFWSHPEKSRQLIERLAELFNLSITLDKKTEDEKKSKDKTKYKGESISRDETKPEDETNPKDETKPKDKTKSKDEIEEYEGPPVNLTNVWNKLIINFARQVLSLKEDNRTGGAQ